MKNLEVKFSFGLYKCLRNIWMVPKRRLWTVESQSETFSLLTSKAPFLFNFLAWMEFSSIESLLLKICIKYRKQGRYSFSSTTMDCRSFLTQVVDHILVYLANSTFKSQNWPFFTFMLIIFSSDGTMWRDSNFVLSLPMKTWKTHPESRIL